MKQHTLTLLGGPGDELRVPLEALHEALGALLDGARQATRFFATGESTRKGPRPAWVDAACALEVTGLTTGSAVVHIGAPPLVEAAPERFGVGEQMSLYAAASGLDPTQTSIELFAGVLVAALGGDRAAIRADRALLETCARFARAHAHSDRGILLGGITGHGSIAIGPKDAARLELLRDETPSSSAVRVTATLDTISASRPDATLRLADGETVVVRLDERDQDLLRALFGHKVVVSGMAHFRPSGRVSLIVAEHLAAASRGDELFAALPAAKPNRAVMLPLNQDEGSGVTSFFGTWPGEESEHELLGALAAIR
jgi:hypothetical protein